MTNKGITIIGIFLVAIFLIFVFSKTPTTKLKGEANVTVNISLEAKDLYLSALLTGKGKESYGYVYEEDRNGYILKVTLLKNKENAKVVEEIPLSKRTVYFTNNATILCAKIRESNEVCAYAENSTNVNDYTKRLKDLLFDEEKMLRNVEDSSFLIERGFLTFSSIEEKDNPIGKCSKVNFNIDYSKLTIGEASRFGIGTGSPIFFSGYYCVDKNKKEPYEKYFNYTFRGLSVYTHFKLISSNFDDVPEINLPLNVSNRLSSTIIAEEEEAVSEFLRCYKKIDAKERESCIYTHAIYNKEVDACMYSGSKKDLCFLNVAVVKKDANVCPSIASAEYKDDCYIEVAGLMKDQSLCSLVADQTKAAKCNEVATSEKEVTTPSTRYVDSDTIEIANYNETKEREETERLVEGLISED